MSDKKINFTGLMRVNEAAVYLAVSDRTIWALLKENKIRPMRFGGCTRIERTELDRFIRAARGAGV